MRVSLNELRQSYARRTETAGALVPAVSHRASIRKLVHRACVSLNIHILSCAGGRQRSMVTQRCKTYLYAANQMNIHDPGDQLKEITQKKQGQASPLFSLQLPDSD
jgi:hypothetical protein